MSEALTLRLRHGTSEPIRTEVPADTLSRIKGLATKAAIDEILRGLPLAQKAYGAAMRATMNESSSVVEVVNIGTEEAVSASETTTFAETLERVSAPKEGTAKDTEAEIEIGTARLERGG